MKNIDALLRRHDAEPNGPLTTAESVRSEELLGRIVNTPFTEPENVVRRPLHRRPLTLSLAGVAAASVVAGALVATNLTANHGTTSNGTVSANPQAGGKSQPGTLTTAELDAWSATPTHPKETGAILHTISTCLFGGTHPKTAALISNIDQRGTVITFMATVAGRQNWNLCDSTGVVLSELVNSPSMPLPSVGHDTVNYQSAGMHGSGAGAVSYAWGQAGKGVTGVVLTTSAGEKITATVQDGFWTLWWPPHDKTTGDLLGNLTLTWTTSNGATHSAAAMSLIPASAGTPTSSASSASVSTSVPSSPKVTASASAAATPAPAGVTASASIAPMTTGATLQGKPARAPGN